MAEQSTSILGWVREYIRRGLSLVKVRGGAKNPVEDDWPTRTYTEHDHRHACIF